MPEALNLNQTIIEFFVLTLAKNPPRFTANDLRHYVNAKNFGTAPASADRVMRLLKKKGVINYAVVNRGRSLYQAVPLEFPAQACTGVQ